MSSITAEPLGIHTAYEEGVIPLDGLHELSGDHDRLLRQTLRPGEGIRQLFLCPWWECSTQPFGVEPLRAWHTVCLTDGRLIITRQYLEGEGDSSVIAIDRDSLVGLEFGEALLMSWLAIRVRRGNRVATEGFYFPSRGNACVASLLRDIRQQWPARSALRERTPCVSQEAIFESIGYFHRRLVQPLFLPDDRCLRFGQRRPIWGTRVRWWRRRQAGLAYWGTLLLSDRDFLYVCGKPPLGPKAYVFDYNLVSFSLSEVRRVEHQQVRAHDVSYSLVRLGLDESGQSDLEILFPEEQADVAEEWTRELTALRT
jgi:hypothetical protein